MSAVQRIPLSRSPSIRMLASAISLRSRSPNRSAASGRKPALRAAPARARAETAATRISAMLGDELAGPGEGVPKIEEDRLLRVDHRFEEAGFGSVFEIADDERADADGAVSADLLAIRFQSQSFDSRWRDGVHVSGDQQARREFELLSGKHLQACPCR